MNAPNMNDRQARVGLVMGSSSDWPTMQFAADILEQFQIPFEAKVLSAHRMPDAMFDYATSSQGREVLRIFLACLLQKPLFLFMACRSQASICGVRIHFGQSYKCQTVYPLLPLPLARLALQMQRCM
jgi:5-(carboxyamino)imidazole ribonucleotide mutase